MKVLLVQLCRDLTPVTDIDVRADSRACYIARIGTLPVPLTIPSIYPRLFGIHNMRASDGLSVESPDSIKADGIDRSRVRLPRGIWPSAEFLDRNGIYLLVTGDVMFLLIGEEADPEQLKDLFGVGIKKAEDLPPVSSCC